MAVVQWLEQSSNTLEVPSLKSPGPWLSSLLLLFLSTVSLIRSLKRGASLLFFLFPIIALAVLPEAEQALISTETGFKDTFSLKFLQMSTNLHRSDIFRSKRGSRTRDRKLQGEVFTHNDRFNFNYSRTLGSGFPDQRLQLIAFVVSKAF